MRSLARMSATLVFKMNVPQYNGKCIEPTGSVHFTTCGGLRQAAGSIHFTIVLRLLSVVWARGGRC